MDEVIKIEFGAVENLFAGRGFLPVIWVNGKRHGSTRSGVGYDKEDALELAEFAANEEAARYVGDWDVTVSPQ